MTGSSPAEREEQFVEHMQHFTRREFSTFEGAIASDVTMVLPGSSWLAGTFTGYEGVRRCILGLRRVLDSKETALSFLHEGNHMFVRHEIVVHGPTHQVTMRLRVRVRYNDDDEVDALFVEPEDLGLFDHVVNSVLMNQDTA